MLFGMVQVGENGSWIFLVFCNLLEGSYNLMVSVIDLVGNISVVFVLWMIVVDIMFLVILVFIFVVDDQFGIIGNLVSGQLMNDVMFILNGCGEVGVMINVYFDGNFVFIGIMMVNSDGMWSFMLQMLFVNGSYMFIFSVIDLVGNSSVVFSGFVLMIDVILFVVLVIVSVVDNMVLVMGIVFNGGLMNEI